jgi:hypothetical protein
MNKTRWEKHARKNFLLNIKIDIFKDLKRIAKKQDDSITKVINDALEVYTQAMKDQEAEEKKNG